MQLARLVTVTLGQLVPLAMLVRLARLVMQVEPARRVTAILELPGRLAGRVLLARPAPQARPGMALPDLLAMVALARLDRPELPARQVMLAGLA